MNTFLLKKEIRLVLPAWLAVLALEMGLPWIGWDWDTNLSLAPALFFFGMVILAMGSFGREFSLGTFLPQMAQPVERRQLWRTKIAVLIFAAAVVFAGYVVSSEGVLHHALYFSNWHRSPAEMTVMKSDFHQALLDSGAAMLVALAGGLWTTLLLRQTAAAFWTTFLAPAGLLMAIVFLLPPQASGDMTKGVLYGAAGLYVVAGFWFARRLFNRAQDAAWTGGIISFSSWRYLESGSAAAVSTRRRKPVAALVKKELQLQSVSFICAATLLALHLVILVMRKVHGSFERDSMAGTASEFFWALWLVMPLIISSTAVAEERKLGVAEGQFCQPVSRRVQFALKFFPAILFGTLLGGVMPWLVENLAVFCGLPNQGWRSSHGTPDFSVAGLAAFALGLSLAGFYASTLAKNFLQALGLSAITFIGGFLFFVAAANQWHSFLGIPLNPKLTLGFGVLTALAVVPALSYGNFKQFQESGRSWRRNVLGLMGAGVFVFLASGALYNRAWEVFEPAEPAHGPAKFSLTNPPLLRHQNYDANLLVQLPDGRVWFDEIGFIHSQNWLGDMIRAAANPFPSSVGPHRFLTGSNWVSVVDRLGGALETVGIQSDGTLWVSDKPSSQTRNNRLLAMDSLRRFGNDTHWQAVSCSSPQSPVFLLKQDGTLWHWGTLLTNPPQSLADWPALRDSSPERIGTNSDWQELADNSDYVKQADGSVWAIWLNPGKGTSGVSRDTNLDQVDLQKSSLFMGDPTDLYVHKDGTLWGIGAVWQPGSRDSGFSSRDSGFKPSQIGKDTNWVSVVKNERSGMGVALKSDGTLWQFWKPGNFIGNPADFIRTPPTRLGIHHDWVALKPVQGGVVSLAADGSLWLWTHQGASQYYEPQPLLKTPKQPEWLGNVLAAK